MIVLLVAASAVDLATEAGTGFRDVGIAVIAVLIPLAVALMCAKWVLGFVHRMMFRDGPGGGGWDYEPMSGGGKGGPDWDEEPNDDLQRYRL